MNLKIKPVKNYVFKNELLKSLINMKSKSLGLKQKRIRVYIMMGLSINHVRLSQIETGKIQPGISEVFWFLDFFCSKGMELDNINIFYREV